MRAKINSFILQKNIRLKFSSDIISFCLSIPVLLPIVTCLLNDNIQFWWCSKISNFSNLFLFSGHSCINTCTAHQAFLIFYSSFQLASMFLPSSLNALEQSLVGCLGCLMTMLLGTPPSWTFLSEHCQGSSVPDTTCDTMTSIRRSSISNSRRLLFACTCLCHCIHSGKQRKAPLVLMSSPLFSESHSCF